jgi:MFS family permease
VSSEAERENRFRGAGMALLAAAAMVATLPGRTHGLGLITEPLLADLGLDRVAFASLNFWATLLGAAFCLPIGWLLDRVGMRTTLAGVLLALGATVVAMAALEPQAASLPLPAPETVLGSAGAGVRVPALLFLLVLLTRGLGQSGLSVVSLGIVGKAAGDRPGRLIGLYSFLVAVGFMAAFMAVKGAFEWGGADWRSVWRAIGLVLLASGIMFPLLVGPIVAGPGEKSAAGGDAPPARGATLPETLATPAFWVFGLATSFYGLVAAGLSLFNQSILAERGFDRDVFLTITSLAPLVGLAANLLGGWLAARVPLGRVAAAGLGTQAAALAAFPFVDSLAGVYAYAGAMALGGGLLTVVFFSVWRQAYGSQHLGSIQGTAQLLTVIASAAGPVILAIGQKLHGSYAPVVNRLALVSILFAVMTTLVPMPVTPSSPENDP